MLAGMVDATTSPAVSGSNHVCGIARGRSRAEAIRRTPPKFGGLAHLAGQYATALGITGTCTALVFPFYSRFGPVNTVMLYLFATACSALRLRRGPCIALATTNVLAFDYFFVPPIFSFDVEDIQYVFTLAVMLSVALVITQLMVNIRRHREASDARERRTAVLYAMSRELMVAKDPVEMSAAAVRHISTVFDSQVAVLMAGQDETLRPVSLAGAQGMDPLALLHSYDLAFAQSVAARGERRANEAAYLPLVGTRRAGVIIVRPRCPACSIAAEHLSLLDAFAAQLATSLQRAWVAEEVEAARMDTERAQLRNTLLSSISHDLRTPLAAIASAGNLIAQDSGSINIDRRMILGQLIESKAADMTRLISNMLDLVRMELGEGIVRAEWHAVNELVSHSLRVNAARLAGWRVLANIPDDLPLVLVQATLIVQIFNNLLENVTKYTPAGTTITLSATVDDECLLVDFSDDGPGLPADSERLFEKFERGHSESNECGVGLGLAICRTAAHLHGGDVRASRSPSGGARFEVILRVPMRNLSSAELQLSA